MAYLFYDSVCLAKGDRGVYAIVNRINGKMYIGSSVNLVSRKRQHRSDILLGKSRSIRLQKDGIENPECFEFVVIEMMPMATLNLLLEREQFWMDFYRSYESELGYNVCSKSDSSIGVKRSLETIKKVSDAHKGLEYPTHRKKIIQSDMDGVEIRQFESITEASKAMGFERPVGNICSAANGNLKSAYGYKWRYA